MKTVTIVETRPLVVHAVTQWPFSRRGTEGGFEVRPVALRVVAVLLGITIADLDCVRTARSLADLRHCPACRPGPRSSA